MTTLLALVAAHAAPPLRSAHPEALAIAQEALDTAGPAHRSYALVPQWVVEANPPVWIPFNPGDCGTAAGARLDDTHLTELTLALFAAHGRPLRPTRDLSIRGIAFEADGWNADLRVGYERIESHRVPETWLRGGHALPVRASDLSAPEVTRVNTAVAEGELNLLVLPAPTYVHYDGDPVPALHAYLQSVLDYLDWLDPNP